MFSDKRCSVIVNNLHPNVTYDILYELFMQVGPVHFILLHEAQPNCIQAEIDFVHEDSVLFACETLNLVPLFHTPITITPSNSEKRAIWAKMNEKIDELKNKTHLVGPMLKILRDDQRKFEEIFHEDHRKFEEMVENEKLEKILKKWEKEEEKEKIEQMVYDRDFLFAIRQVHLARKYHHVKPPITEVALKYLGILNVQTAIGDLSIKFHPRNKKKIDTQRKQKCKKEATSYQPNDLEKDFPSLVPQKSLSTQPSSKESTPEINNHSRPTFMPKPVQPTISFSQITKKPLPTPPAIQLSKESPTKKIIQPSLQQQNLNNLKKNVEKLSKKSPEKRGEQQAQQIIIREVPKIEPRSTFMKNVIDFANSCQTAALQPSNFQSTTPHPKNCKNCDLCQAFSKLVLYALNSWETHVNGTLERSQFVASQIDNVVQKQNLTIESKKLKKISPVKSPKDVFQFVVPENLNEKNQWNCNICHIWCNGQEKYESHLKSPEHMKMSTNIKLGIPIPNEEDITGPPPNYFCELCFVQCIGEETWLMHLNGKTHLKNTMNFGKESLDKHQFLVNKYKCNICEINAISQQQLQEHLNGKTHAKKLARAIREGKV